MRLWGSRIYHKWEMGTSMTKHIHIYVHGKTKDADGPAHAPAGSSKGGQFVSGGGGSSGAKSDVSPEQAAVPKAWKPAPSDVSPEQAAVPKAQPKPPAAKEKMAGKKKPSGLSPERIKKFEAATRMAQLKNDQKLKKKVPTH